MNVKNNTPDIRFNGFSGNWELKPLESIFARIRNAFVGTATPYYVKKGHFYLESNNIKNGLVNRNTEVFIDDEFHLKQKDKWLKTGDIVMVQSGHVGHSAVIPKELNNTAAHALIMFTDRKQATNPYFLNYQFSNENTKLKIDKITTGNTIKHILSSDMKIFECYFPIFEEQNTIGNFFQHINENISLSRLKHDKTKAIKNAFLSKIFPQAGTNQPEIRLKGFSGDWIEVKLEDTLLEQIKGKAQFDKLSNGVVEYLDAARLNRGKPFLCNAKNDVLQSDILIIWDGSNAGKVYRGFEGALGSTLKAYRTNEKYSSEFVFQHLLKNEKVIFAEFRTPNIPHVVKDFTSSYTVTAPNIEEQTAIGNFFKQLDDTLALQVKQLKALESLKKALLAKMFV